MSEKRRYYTHYPRPILWLIPGGEIDFGGLKKSIDPFYLSKSPVTNEQLEAYDPSFVRSPLSGGDRDPAAGVSYSLAQAYAEWYAEVSRKPMRLPTDLEWEYACRGGCFGRFYFEPDELDSYVWHAGNSDGRVRSPERKTPNPFGLNGMLGNLWDWTTRQEELVVGEPQQTLRGGSFRSQPEEISCDMSRLEAISVSPEDAGFRIAKSLGRENRG